MNEPTAPAIRLATSEADFAALGALFRAYEQELGVDLCFQKFDDELADIRGTYEAALIAGDARKPLGCVALKRLSPERCEMKRLYVRPEARRSSGLGRTLAARIVEEGRRRGYREMALDTLERLAPAIRLYESMGFERTAAYYDNPEPDVVYMRLTL